MNISKLCWLCERRSHGNPVNAIARMYSSRIQLEARKSAVHMADKRDAHRIAIANNPKYTAQYIASASQPMTVTGMSQTRAGMKNTIPEIHPPRNEVR